MTPRCRRSRTRFTALVASLGLVLAGCAEDAPMDSLEPEGPVAQRLDELFMPVFWVAAAVFVIVQGALLYAIVKFRRRKETADLVPAQVHGNTRLEIGWTLAPALVLAVIAVPTIGTVVDLAEEPAASERLDVEVFGAQFWWEYEYANGAVTANELVIPTGRDVYLTMTSRDVIHSFWPPKLTGKRDVVPGRIHQLTFRASEPGDYYGQCAEFCGDSHANMRLRVIAMEPAEFEQWLEDQARDAEEPRGELVRQGAELFVSRGCTSCHVIRGVNELPRDVDRLRELGIPWAPDLTHYASRSTFAGAIFENTPTNLARWLRDPPGMKDGALMPDLGLTEPDIDALVAYLLSLE